MSYILDALKKAEADKDPDVRASLALQHTEQRRQHLIMTLVGAALLINAAVLAWVFFPRLEENADVKVVAEAAPSESAPAPAPPVATPSGAGSSSDLATAPETTKVEEAVGAEMHQALVQVEAPEGAVSDRAEPSRVTFKELPRTVRRRFPALSFSTHVFTDEPELRALVVDGRRLGEGDRYGALRLDEITADGAVFEFEDYLVAVSILEDWN